MYVAHAIQVLKQVLPADGIKKVQEAGISALSVIMEESYYFIFDPVVNQLAPILRAFDQVRDGQRGGAAVGSAMRWACLCCYHHLYL